MSNLLLASLHQAQFHPILEENYPVIPSAQTQPESALPALKRPDDSHQEASTLNLLRPEPSRSEDPRSVRVLASPATAITHPAASVFRLLLLGTCYLTLLYALPAVAEVLLVGFLCLESVAVLWSLQARSWLDWTVFSVEIGLGIATIVTELVGGTTSTTASVMSKLFKFFKLGALAAFILHGSIFAQGPSVKGCLEAFQATHMMLIVLASIAIWTTVTVVLSDAEWAYRTISGDAWFQDLVWFLRMQTISIHQQRVEGFLIVGA